ncbi:MAG: DUF421 domain-containing protein [Clostridia bacterium]|nr:DUF421 domain-containing protein [Clostridia bacterium]
MIIIIAKTAFLYFFMIFVMRLMGKRQIGQLQPGELVITIMISEIATMPLENDEVSLLNAVIPITVLVILEIIVSFVSLKIIRLREIFQGHSVVVIRNGIPDKKELKKLRYSMDDLLESLRQKDVFDISDVQYAIVETDGSVSVLLKPEKRNATVSDVGAEPDTNGLPMTLISDGRVLTGQIEKSPFDEEEIKKLLRRKHLDRKDVMLLTVDNAGNINLIKNKKKKSPHLK